ncbi:MAG: exodeoxyribonuclease VII small subunit [Phycisphaerae bacterium]
MGKKRPTFEEAMRRLEQIVESIEHGDIGLEESIKQFEVGMKLIRQCRSVLSEAELRIQKLQAVGADDLKIEDTEPEGEV